MPQNLEQFLVLEVQASVEGRPLPSAEYRNAPDLVAGLTNQGSGNWGPMGWSVRYRQGDPAAGPKWAEFFARSREVFMGDEELSTTYGLWGHLLPVAAVHDQAAKNGDAENATAALEWLRYFFGVYELCRAPDGTILTVGMRSSPWHAPEQASTWLGWVRALARGEDLAPWEALGKKWGLGMGQSFIPPTARAVLPSLAAAATSPEPLPRLAMMVPLHVLRGEGWLAVWLERNVNGNTPPLLGAVWRDGAASYLPSISAPTMRRIRQKFDEGTCRRDGEVLVYDSNLYGHQEAPLPAGGQETVLGLAGDPGPVVPPAPEPAPAPAPQPAPPPAPAPAAPIDLQAIADVVAGLAIPNKQQAFRAGLVAELRGGSPRPLSAIADDVATLGIGDNQEQAPRWRQAIAQLRGTGASPMASQ
jgi:hypothetical protein